MVATGTACVLDKGRVVAGSKDKLDLAAWLRINLPAPDS